MSNLNVVARCASLLSVRYSLSKLKQPIVMSGAAQPRHSKSILQSMLRADIIWTRQLAVKTPIRQTLGQDRDSLILLTAPIIVLLYRKKAPLRNLT